MSDTRDVDLAELGSIPDPIAARAPSKAPEAKAPSERSLTRDERRRRYATLAGLAVVYLVLLLARAGLRPDLATGSILLQLFVWSVVVVAGLSAVVRPGSRGLPSSVRFVQIALFTVAATFTVISILGSQMDIPIDWTVTRGCLLLASTMSLGPLILAGFALRNTFLSAATWRGAAVGAACGLGGSIGVHAHCPIQSTPHILLAHGFPILLGAAVGAAMGASKGRA